MNTIVLSLGKRKGIYYVEGLGLVKVPMHVAYIKSRRQWILRHPVKGTWQWKIEAYGGADQCLLKIIDLYKSLKVPMFKYETRIVTNVREDKRHRLPLGIGITTRRGTKSSSVWISCPKKKTKEFYVPVQAIEDDSILDEILETAEGVRREEIEEYKRAMLWKGLYDF